VWGRPRLGHSLLTDLQRIIPCPFDPPPRRRALICDIDDTLCVQFDVPIAAACALLAALDRGIEVHYVTARPEASRAGTERFLVEQRLPGWRNLHFCRAGSRRASTRGR
jgi:hypothetical protein